MINWRNTGGNNYTRQSRNMSAGIYNKSSGECSGGKVASGTTKWRIGQTRTYSDFTLFAPAFSAEFGALFTDSKLEYYGKNFNWNTLLR
jgi:hypothetical protein